MVNRTRCGTNDGRMKDELFSFHKWGRLGQHSSHKQRDEGVCGTAFQHDETDQPVAGGISLGGEIQAWLRPQDCLDDEIPIFPGSIRFTTPLGELVLENKSPDLDFADTLVFWNGVEITNNILDVRIDVNAVDNIVESEIKIYEPRILVEDEIHSVSLF